jgi:hypothetical protein
MTAHPWHEGVMVAQPHLLGPDASPQALETCARGWSIMRILAIPLQQRGEFLQWLEYHVEAVEPTTPHLGGLWRWRDVIEELKWTGQKYIPAEYRQAAAVP